MKLYGVNKLNKKGVEMTTNTVVVIVLVLLVLIAMVFFMVKGFGSWSSGTTCPIPRGAQCLSACGATAPYPMPFSCPDKNFPACCSADPTLKG